MEINRIIVSIFSVGALDGCLPVEKVGPTPPQWLRRQCAASAEGEAAGHRRLSVLFIYNVGIYGSRSVNSLKLFILKD